MDGIDLRERMTKLNEAEERELTEFRRKRSAEQKILGKVVKEHDEKKRNGPTTKEEVLTERLEERKRKNFQLQIEASAWERVAKSSMNELRNAEKVLNEKHQRIWQGRDEFCDRVDRFVRRYESYSKCTEAKFDFATGNSWRRPGNDQRDEIERMKKILSAEEEAERDLDAKLRSLERDAERLLMETDGEEFKRLEEQVEIVRERCRKLERQIADRINSRKECGKEIGSESGRDGVSAQSRLFSFVSLEDVKRFNSQFRTNTNEST